MAKRLLREKYWAGRSRQAGVAVKPVTIIGSYVSPYVRKVLVALHLKGIPYEIDPIIPFFGDDRFSSSRRCDAFRC